MALINCNECSKEISSEAKACPHYGAPVPKEGVGWFAKLILFVVALFVGMLVLGALLPHKEQDSYDRTADLFCEQAHRDAKTSLEKMIADKQCEQWRQATDRARQQGTK